MPRRMVVELERPLIAGHPALTPRVGSLPLPTARERWGRILVKLARDSQDAKFGVIVGLRPSCDTVPADHRQFSSERY